MLPTFPDPMPPVDAGARQRLVSVSAPCAQVDPMQAFLHGAGRERFYWQDPRGGVTHVGFGVAADLRGWGSNRFQSIAQQATALFANAHLAIQTPAFAEPHLFGGFAFSDDFTPDNTWSVYYPAQFILPHYQLSMCNKVAGESETWLTINALLDVTAEVSAAKLAAEAGELAASLSVALAERIEQLQQTRLHMAELPQLHSQNYPMSYPAWEQILNTAITQFKTGALSKVVLSRVCELRFQQNLDVAPALAYLNRTYPDCYRFVFEPRPHHAFLGASPELLVNLRGQQITTMGLAGSEPRGSTPAADAALGQQLMHSAKDRREHQLVVDALRQRLQPLCRILEIADQPQLLKLSNIQHLYTPVTGTLNAPQSILNLLEVLHPTPALGGAPRAPALEFIRQMEPAPRGWYAAPVGVLNRHMAGTFTVAIRSAVTDYERVWLHAGAGIVEASNPQKEWDETALKFRPILNALQVGA
ncbi:MAG: isochorismate synthase [Caldilineaceae bacterium]